jgi:hypothetical protein
MRRTAFGLSVLSLALTGALGAAQPAKDLVVHEWGTFLAMHGSDGITLDGMYHEEHALPEFVHSRSKDQLRIPSVVVKGETPVIYFYTTQPQKVTVHVAFPGGIWTQWYPQASLVGPQLSKTHTPLDPKDGSITWFAEILPDQGKPLAGYPSTSKDALWNFARDVDAAWVRTTDRTRGNRPDVDRFLFHRGLGQAKMPVQMTAAENGTLQWTDSSFPAAKHVFILRVENGRGAYRYLPELSTGRPLTGLIPSMTGARPLAEFTHRIADDLAARLVQSGLFEKEARAMVNTWRSSYFQNDGIRALFVMPQEWTDRYIPLKITPQPQQVVRVMVGRTELLTPDRERRAEAAVRDLAASDSEARNHAFDYLREQGRYVEPIVRRVLRTTTDERVRALCKRLLLTPFVTELRAAIHSAADGTRVADKPVHVRAQLANLLREIGMDEEAKAESKAVLDELRRQPEPPMDEPSARHYFRAIARATEAGGDDRAATAAYEKFVRFGAHVKKCGGCHDSEGPKNMTWFRDWYAGRKLAEVARRAGLTRQLIEENERRLAGGRDDTAAQMLLAYLYEAQGDQAKADSLWVRIGPSTGVKQAAR